MNWTDRCGLDGCKEWVEVSLRPDGRYRVNHGGDEGATTFLTPSEMLVTTGWWPFVRTLHDEQGRARLNATMGQQAIARLQTTPPPTPVSDSGLLSTSKGQS